MGLERLLKVLIFLSFLLLLINFSEVKFFFRIYLYTSPKTVTYVCVVGVDVFTSNFLKYLTLF